MRPSATVEAMKARLMRVITIVITPIFLVMIMTSVMFGQSDHPKRADLTPDSEAPWGLAIKFIEQTSIPQERVLRDKYGLEVAPGGYQKADPGPYLGQVFDESLYSGDELSFYYHLKRHKGDTRFDECLASNSCPPVFVDQVRYEPVKEEIVAALLEESIVAQLENQKNESFFFLKKIIVLIDWVKGITTLLG